MKKLLKVLFVLALILIPMKSLKAEGEKYTVMVYAGNQGEFSDGKKEKPIEVTAGQAVTIDLNALGLKVTNEKYYARGLVLAGHDNDEDEAFQSRTFADGINEDVSYVVRYGIRGDMVKYTVRYIGPDGSVWGEDEYYGMEGDKPIVAAKYFEGYLPNAYNETKKLVADESKNVFPFTYIVVPSGTQVIYVDVPGGGGGASGGGGGGGNTPTPTPTPGPDEGGEVTPTPGPDEGGETPTPGPTPEVPDIIDIDDDDTPATRPDQDGSSILPWAAGGAVVGIGGLWGLLYFLKKKKKDDEEKVA